MSLEVIYVVRHGFRSSWSVDHRTGTYTSFLRSPTGLPTDPALTSHGVEQADDLAQHLLCLDPPIDQVYSSPYYRCLQTISPFVLQRNAGPSKVSSMDDDDAVRLRLGIRVESGLSEWYGRAHFEHPTSAPLSDLCTLFADIDMNYTSSPAPLRHGESIPQLYERVATCMQAIIAQCDQEGKKVVLVSTHAAVVIALGRVLTANIPEDVSVDDFGAFTCGLSMYRRQRINQDCDIPTTADKTAYPRHTSREYEAFQDENQIVDSPPAPLATSLDRPVQPGCDNSPQRRGASLFSQWDCQINSDCSFLRDGEERGWRFSGDESFVDVSHESLSLSTLETSTGCTLEKDGQGSSCPKL